MTGAGVERLEAQVVEDEQIGASEGFQKARMAPVAARQGEVLAELRHAVIERRNDCRGRPSGRGAGEPTLADAGRTDESQVIVGVDPLAVGELLEQSAVEPARAAIVDVFDARLLAQLGGAQPRRQPFVAPPARLRGRAASASHS